MGQSLSHLLGVQDRSDPDGACDDSFVNDQSKSLESNVDYEHVVQGPTIKESHVASNTICSFDGSAYTSCRNSATPEAIEQIATQEVNPQIATQEVNQHIATQEVNPQIATQEVNQHIATQEVNQQIATQEVNQHIATQEVNPQIATQEVNQHIATQEVNPHIATQEVNPHIPTQEVNPHLATQEVNQHIATQEVNQHIATQEVNPHIATQEVNQHIITTPTESEDTAKPGYEILENYSSLGYEETDHVPEATNPDVVIAYHESQRDIADKLRSRLAQAARHLTVTLVDYVGQAGATDISNLDDLVLRVPCILLLIDEPFLQDSMCRLSSDVSVTVSLTGLRSKQKFVIPVFLKDKRTLNSPTLSSITGINYQNEEWNPTVEEQFVKQIQMCLDNANDRV